MFIKIIVVKEEDIDFNGHVNNLNYLKWFIQSAIDHSNSLGLTQIIYDKYNVTWVAKSHCIEYLKPAFKNEILTLKTWIDEISKVKAVRKYELYNEKNQLITKGISEWVMIDKAKLRPVKIPEEIKNFYI